MLYFSPNSLLTLHPIRVVLELFHRPCRMNRRLSIYFTRLHVSKTRAWSVGVYCPSVTQNRFDLLIVFCCRKSEKKYLHTSHYNPTPLDHSKETSFLENHPLSK